MAIDLYEFWRRIAESVFLPGNLFREIAGVGDGPVATLAVLMWFVLGATLVLAIEFAARRLLKRDVAILPNYVLVVPPDGGYSTVALLYGFALFQAIGSALV